MSCCLKTQLLLAILTSYVIWNHQSSARILPKCDVARELVRANVERSFINTYACIMKSESKFDTSLKTGPGHRASYSYGIFQISSDRWCSAYRTGGLCNKHCNDFLDDNIQDDIACAKKIADQKGFKHWNGWVKYCKNSNLPNVLDCVRRDHSNGEVDYSDDDFIEGEAS